MRVSLQALGQGQSATLLESLTPSGCKPELERLGLIPGTQVRCLRRLRFGRAAVYGFADTVLALRDETAADLLCES